MKHEGVERYRDVVAKWDRNLSLLSRGNGGYVSDAMLGDSRTLATYFRPDDHHVDIGTGNGLPILPALAIANIRPSKISVVEADRRKAAFLRAATREMGLDVTVIAERIENSGALSANSISAKAFAPLPRLLDLAVPHLAPGGRILAFKGRQAGREIAEAAATWDFEIEKNEVDDGTGAVLLVIRNPKRRTSE